tara:strand:+ start:1905 stop:2675 length:771 start_codon:yes stop_codon:yes gene_type:complete
MIKAVRAKKYLGQHFLINNEIAKDIVALISDIEKVSILEIGPGMGILTNFLVEKSQEVTVIEIDKESINFLKKKIPKLNKKIIEGDFLDVNLNKIFENNFTIIGNFPYNISSQILFKVFENKNIINEIVGMFQKEVAERVAAKKGKKRGILSVFIQTFFDVEYCFSVNENEFSPPPKVKSGIIKLKRNNRKELKCDNKLYKKIVKTTFNQRRKTIKNSLKSLNLDFGTSIDNLMHLRAESLTVEDFINITNNAKTI